MFTQKESQLTAKLLWHDWFPSVWLDEHQQGSNGARIFVMPATDPINPNVHPLIYRWNGILGPVAGGRARGRRQGRHHLQLHLHELLAGGDGVERLVAQPDRPADRSRERARRGADRAAARGARPCDRLRAGQRCAWRRTRRWPRRRRRHPAAADRHQLAHRVSAPLAGRPLDAARHRRLRADRDDGAARHAWRIAARRSCSRSTK